MADACKTCNTNAEKSNIDEGMALKDALEQVESFQESVTECVEESGTPPTSDDDDEERKALAADIMAAVAAVDSSDDSDDHHSDDGHGNDGEENESSPDEEGDEHDETKLDRVKRWDRYSRGHSKGQHNGKKYKTTKVTFGFSKNKYNLADPKCKHGFKCGDKTELLDLTKYRNGQWKREYTIVSKEMQHSKVHHKLCAEVKNCFKPYKIIKIYKLNNKCLWTAFKYEQANIFAENHKFSNTQMLWHGSKNIDSVVNEGMNEGYARLKGNMYGAGLYFAKHASKSNQYVWGDLNEEGCPTHTDKNCNICQRKLLLCRVVLGRSQEVYSKQTDTLHPKPGYHSLVAKPKKGVLKYAEYIVYKGTQDRNASHNILRHLLKMYRG